MAPVAVVALALLTAALAAATLPAPPAPPGNAVEALLAWAADAGADVANVRVGTSTIGGAGRALLTLSPVLRGHLLIAVPTKLAVTDVVANAATSTDAPGEPLLPRYAPASLRGDSCLDVTLFLFLEHVLPGRRNASFWLPYYRSLPPLDASFNLPQVGEWANHPEALEVLRSAPSTADRLSSEEKLHAMTLRRLHAEVFPALVEDTGLSSAELERWFVWAKKVILTRSWTKAHSSVPGDCTLVPVMDMLNHHERGGGLVAVAYEANPSDVHSLGVLAKWDTGVGEDVVDSYDPSDREFWASYGVGVKEGSETRAALDGGGGAEGGGGGDGSPDADDEEEERGMYGLKGGRKCMSDLLIGFGFLPAHGSGRAYCFAMTVAIGSLPPLPAASAPGLRRGQLNMIARLIGHGDDAADTIHAGTKWVVKLRDGASKLPSRLMAVIRLCMADEAAVTDALHRGDRGVRDRPLHLENERKALRMLHSMMAEQLARMPSSEAADARRLEQARSGTGGGVGTNLELALRVRLGERRVMRQTIALVERTWAGLLYQQP